MLYIIGKELVCQTTQTKHRLTVNFEGFVYKYTPLQTGIDTQDNVAVDDDDMMMVIMITMMMMMMVIMITMIDNRVVQVKSTSRAFRVRMIDWLLFKET